MFFSKQDFRAELRMKFWLEVLCIDNFVEMYILFIENIFLIYINLQQFFITIVSPQ